MGWKATVEVQAGPSVLRSGYLSRAFLTPLIYHLPAGRISTANLWNDLSVSCLPEDAEFVVIIVAFSFPVPCSRDYMALLKKQGNSLHKQQNIFLAYILIFNFVFFLQDQDV